MHLPSTPLRHLAIATGALGMLAGLIALELLAARFHGITGAVTAPPWSWRCSGRSCLGGVTARIAGRGIPTAADADGCA